MSKPEIDCLVTFVHRTIDICVQLCLYVTRGLARNQTCRVTFLQHCVCFFRPKSPKISETVRERVNGYYGGLIYRK